MPILIEDYPSRMICCGEENVSPQILGIYIGVPRTEAEDSAQADDIRREWSCSRGIWRRSVAIATIWSSRSRSPCGTRSGHHLGLSEEDLERLGLA